MAPEVIPWMSPCLSQSMSFVLAGIGHPMKFRRGDVIYTSPGLFGNLMYVRSGFVVKALLDPVRDEPLLLSMAGPGALCGNYENLYVRDRMPRRHWCLTSTEVLVVNQELLLKIADQNPEWQHELSGYSSVSSICDRMGMFLNYSGTVEERLGALLGSSDFLVKQGARWYPGRGQNWLVRRMQRSSLLNYRNRCQNLVGARRKHTRPHPHQAEPDQVPALQSAAYAAE